MARKRKAKATKRKGKKIDKCEPLRKEIGKVVAEIRPIEINLDEPKLTPQTKANLRRLLKRLKAQLKQLERRLAKCIKSAKKTK